MTKLKVAVIFGGRSGEHEVSLVSATSVIKALNPDKYAVVEIGITHEGEWFAGENCLEKFKKKDFGSLRPIMLSTKPHSLDFDIAFPVLHGPFGEDGTIQGLFEMFQIPYVGCGVLASSTAMDKLQCKAILQSAGVTVVPYVGFNRKAWQKEKETILDDIENNLGIPCFVKPANMGSSVGVSKAKTREELMEAIDFAARFDSRILVEKAVNARELECAILGNADPVASPVGEVIVGGEFYDYKDKYVDGKARTQVPANIDGETMKKVQEMSLKSYKLLDCSGLSRVDSFLDRDTGEIYLNEINTLPGFTSISMYPKMMKAYGLNYEQLIDELIELGIERFADRKANQIVFDPGVEWYKK
ncbi:MAG: D-alanine--D-alanine ligase [Candidatus Gracilibacteria bacterium]|nr:D-alanine--D-alanine ligase [Candidatus Gracilibacteria bacterium]